MWFLIGTVFASPKSDVRDGHDALESGQHSTAIKHFGRALDTPMKGALEMRARGGRLRSIATHPDASAQVAALPLAIDDFLWIQRVHPGAPTLPQYRPALIDITARAVESANLGGQGPCVEAIPAHTTALPLRVLTGLVGCATAVNDVQGGRAVVTDLLTEMERTASLDASLLEAPRNFAADLATHDDPNTALAILAQVDAALARIELGLKNPASELGTLRLDEAKAASRNTRLNLLRTSAQIHEAAGKHEAAVQDLDQAITLEPGDVDSRVQRGALLLKLERVEEGVEALQTARKLAPKNARAAVVLGQHWLAQANQIQSQIENLEPKDDTRGDLQATRKQTLERAREVAAIAVANGANNTLLQAICEALEDETCGTGTPAP